MCAQETRNHTCKKKIMLKHTKASLQCRRFSWVNLFETSTSPLATPGHLTFTCARGVGNLTITWVGWGIWTRSVKLTSLDDPGLTMWFNRCDLSHGEMEDHKGKQTACSVKTWKATGVHFSRCNQWKQDRVFNCCSSITSQHYVKSGKLQNISS